MKKVLVATPALNGQVTTGYLLGVMESLRHAAENKSYSLDFMFLEQTSLISKARDIMVSDFYLKMDHDYLVFIDADQGFRGTAIYDLIHAPGDVMVAPVPMKSIDYTALHAYAIVMSGELSSAALAACVDYNFLPESDETSSENRYIPCLYAGTGFMCIPRITLDRIYKDEKLKATFGTHDVVVGGVKKSVTALFVPVVKSGQLWGEDYSFSMLLRKLNMSIYCDRYICVSHTGTITYEGNLDTKVNFYNELNKIES